MSAATLQDAVDALRRLNCKPVKSGDGWIGYCPIHEADGHGHKPSLTLKAGDTVPVVVNCHAGCDGREILKMLGINGTEHKASIVATYRYQTADGIDVREKLRYDPKDFRIRHRDAAGKWVYKAGDGPAVLYRLPELKAAIEQGRTVFVVEGEKDADRLAALGLVATTNIEGAAKPNQTPKWKPEYTAQLEGAARVVLLPDNDNPGRAHMKHVAKELRGKVGRYQTIRLRVLPKGDVSDWLKDGHTVEELKKLIKETPAEHEEHFEEHSAEHEEHSADDLDAEFVPIGDFIASPPDSSYLVKGVLPASGLGQVFGCSHVGKSFVLIDLACHVALGWDWHGFKVKKAPVLYIAAEGVAGLKLRFRAWFQDHGVEPPQNLRIRTVPADLSAEDATTAIAERMARLPERPGLVLIDTFATNFGPGSENDAEDMGAAIAGLRTLKGDGLILTAHHTGHGDKTRGRGHSSLFAALDVEIQVTQDADRRIRVGHTKLRDGDKLETIAAFDLKKVSLPWADVDGDPLNSAVLVKTDMPDVAATAERLPASQRIALDALKTALVEHGAEDKGVVSVAEDQWRKAAYDAGISDGDSDAKKKAFKRARLDLVAKGRVKTHESRYWIPQIRQGGQKGTKGDMSLYVQDSGGGQKGTPPFKGCPPVPLSPSPSEDVDAKPTTDDLADELATLANLDVAAMLRGELRTDEEWGAFAGGLAKLNGRHPDKAATITALVEGIGIASDAGAP